MFSEKFISRPVLSIVCSIMIVIGGVMAAILNFVPVAGPLVAFGVISLVSIMTFESVTQTIVPPLAYLAVHLLESQVATPLFVSRRLMLNPIAVLLSLIFWTWMWGIPGTLLAVPILDTTLVTVLRLLEGRPIYQGGRDHSSHRLVRFGLSEKHAVALLALIATCIGGSSLAYNVLGNTRYTVVGVVITFALLIQFASFLADVENRSEVAEEPVGITRAFAVHWRRIVEVIADFALITGAFFASYAIVFGWPGSVSERFIGGLTLPVLLAARYLTFIPFGLYRSVWRYAGARDAVSIAMAVVISEVVTLSYMTLTQDMRDFWRSFFIVDALICMIAITGARFAERGVVSGARTVRDRTATRTLIVGAGRTGRSLMRELRETAGERVVGFVDDKAAGDHLGYRGLPLLGVIEEAPEIAMIGRCGSCLRTWPISSIPSICGMIISVIMRSIGVWRQISTASFPSFASSTW